MVQDMKSKKYITLCGFDRMWYACDKGYTPYWAVSNVNSSYHDFCRTFIYYEI